MSDSLVLGIDREDGTSLHCSLPLASATRWGFSTAATLSANRPLEFAPLRLAAWPLFGKKKTAIWQSLHLVLLFQSVIDVIALLFYQFAICSVTSIAHRETVIPSRSRQLLQIQI
jgi:hypothetical protein